MKKKILILLLSLVSMYSWAETSGTCGENGDNITWTLSDDGTLSLVGSGKMKDYTNLYLSPWYNDKKILKISISEGITSIGSYTFTFCSALTSVTIPNSVMSIGESAFDGCSALTSVTIPNLVTSIGNGAFRNCSGLTSMSLPNSLTTIENYTFNGCAAITSISIPNSVTSIGTSAFGRCTNLNRVVLGRNVREIGSSAFSGCNSLNVFISNSDKVPVAGEKCFDGTGYLNGTLYVKKELLNIYSSSSPWYGWGTILAIEDENPDAEKCATPTITYSGNKVSFSCDTKGALYHYSIIPAGANDEMTTTGDVDLTNLVVSVYATADGKAKSETVQKQVSVSTDGPIYIYDDNPLNIDIAEGQSITLRITDGIIHINNAPLKSTIYVYNINGEALMNQMVLDDDVTIKLPRNATYIIKVSEKTFKLKI